MNSRQKEVIQSQLDDEKKVISDLKKVYERARQDTVEAIKGLEARTDVENLQSIVYQRDYQNAIKKQLDSILDIMNTNQFTTISEYLEKCYESGYLGTMYDLQGQGIPLIIPIDQEQVTAAIQLDSKISEGLYKRLGIDTKTLKDSIRANVSRGIAASESWATVARNINNRMGIGLNRAVRIARTEGHRIACESSYHAQLVAKDKGADIVKQWDATLDDKTRLSHQQLDGQIREVEEPFEINGNKAQYPGEFGVASEDINCRCVALQRARWALDEDELEELKKRAEYFGLDKSEDFEDFQKKYLTLPKEADKMGLEEVNPYTGELVTVLERPIETNQTPYKPLFDELNVLEKDYGLKYNPVHAMKKPMTNEEIISSLCGGDRTQGSCASLGLAYVGRKQGWDVLDYRDGESRSFFSRSSRLFQLSHADGVSALHFGDVKGQSSVTLANNFLKTCEVGKEYYLCVGRHAAIVRKTEEGILQYLELQSENNSGWTNFNGNPRYTLVNRFGCRTSSGYGASLDFMINIDDSNFDTAEFRSLLGYINTSESEQRKGYGGTLK